MEHATKDGGCKLVHRCSLPLTGLGVVDRVITDLAVIDVDAGALVLRELAPGVTVEDVQALTEPALHVPAAPTSMA
jgi:3-oxoacid CoA-transferase subunit B